MTQPQESSIIERLEGLERQNRRFKVGIALAVLSVSSLLLMGQAQAPLDIIEAQGFVLVDQDGTKRAELSLSTPSEGLLALNPSWPSEPKLILYRASGDPAIELVSDEVPRLRLYSRDSVSLPTVEIEANGAGGTIDLIGLRGRTTIDPAKVSLVGGVGGLKGTTVIDGGKVFMFSDDGGIARIDTLGKQVMVVLQTDRDPTGAIIMRTGAEGSRVDVSDEAGYSAVLGTSSTVTTRTGETHQKTAASLTMFDDEGNVIAEVP